MNNVLIFDGVCNLCAHSVRFIIEHERGPVIQFVPLQSPAGMALLTRFELNPVDVKTFVFLQNGQVHIQSDAAIVVAGQLRDPWKLLVLLRFIPRAVRNWCYDAIARNRYRWFGRLDTCMVPTPELRARFLEELAPDFDQHTTARIDTVAGARP